MEGEGKIGFFGRERRKGE